MLTCPLCKKQLPRLNRQCPTCQTDLTLLVGYVEALGSGIARADGLARSGKLGEAVAAYLGVLEVDPDNAAAQAQVGSVAAAVRHFDRTHPSRQWMHRPAGWHSRSALPWAWVAVAAAALALAFLAGFVLGVRQTLPNVPAHLVKRTGP
jgi:hypothetical protein